MTNMKNEQTAALPNCLTITLGKGFHLAFDNGYTLSVQIGAYNYGDNYLKGSPQEIPPYMTSTTMELAVICTYSEEFICWPSGRGAGFCDTVKGYVPVAELPAMIEMVSNLPKIQD